MIGAGRVGTAFAALLARAGNEIVAVAGRGATAERAATWLPGVRILPATEAAALGDLVLLGVPDNVLESLVAELAAAEAVAAGTWVTHVSGIDGAGRPYAAPRTRGASPGDASIADLPGRRWSRPRLAGVSDRDHGRRRRGLRVG